ncbi:type II secretion system protein [Telmatospirillum sp. J64-1]|uniref:type II secretion system protein n=1 Tax=Telmatospirillum sp. J64-1 TaxID=2502183 RepID=UPI00115F2714|nr:prepilin-type N-terminal cleavage/methylation domain-containing protein [Telmatospirillum sp. J64-1]
MRDCLVKRDTHRTRQSGFTLIELSIVLVILGIIITMGVEFAHSARDHRRFKTTETKLSTIEEALVLYAARHRRLPCPADATSGTGSAHSMLSGNDVTGCANDQRRGIVPWIDLGLPKDAAIDGWGNFITYRVHADAAMDGTGSCTNISLDTRGVDLQNCQPGSSELEARLEIGLLILDGVGGNPVMDPDELTGAAYVLISHGSNGFGAYSATGSYRAFAANPNAAEQRNANNNPLGGNGNSDAYIDGRLGTFDDLVRHASIMQVAWRANLRPRATP